MAPSPIAVLPHDGTPDDVAVLLNANARAVNRRVIRAVAEVVPSRDLYVSHTLDEAEDIVAEVAGRGYGTVLTGGGDGTFVGFLNALMRQYDRVRSTDASGRVRALARRTLPRLGVLRLGTGNALAHHMGARSLKRAGVLEDILEARSGRLHATRQLDLVEVEGVHTPFSGLGYDALILNNYARWKRLLGAGPLRMFAEGGWGYALSVGLLSIPKALSQWRPPEVEIINRGGPVYRVGVDGRHLAGPIPEGGLLYAGPVRIAAVSTCPYYGLGLKLFPAADTQPGRMQLRVSSSGPVESVAHLRSIFRGTYSSPTIQDFLVESVEMRFSQPMPFQIGGDAAGWRKEVTFSLGASPVEVVDFHRHALAA